MARYRVGPEATLPSGAVSGDSSQIPDIPADVHVHDFGIVSPKTRLKYVFRVKNDSVVTWTPDVIKASCSCTAAAARGSTIRPGQEFELPVRYRSPSDERFDRQRILVHFKEKEAPVLELAVRARTVEDLSVHPKSITIGSLARGHPSSRVIEVFNNTGQRWGKLEVSTDVPWLNTHVRDVSPDSSLPRCTEGWIVEVLIRSGQLTCGPHEGHITIRPNVWRKQPATVTVTASVAPPYRLSQTRYFSVR